MAFEQDRSYQYTGTVQVGKFAAVKAGAGANDFVLAANQNDKPIGIVLDGVFPELASDFKAGSYGNISGLPWPGNVFPPTPTGRFTRTIRTRGRVQAVAAGAITRGDRVMVAGNGLVMTAETLAAGTVFNQLGTADTAAVNNGDIVYIDVLPLPGQRV